ncbi:enolase C-terminal domain-like protein [Bradyrhizobium brasilense]|uniref:L-alanine-DL-glutamate epimerase n=1 Tax=Bradyrhizobium brasilense TaxID=1419277 RepID=A0A1G7QMI2_9BRAD|nr:enolase C-terminal domain-like protein [Bradyrhizobium brasilense]MCC8974321.1 mandelate racemase [Bradyrhizobium brasilense]SDF99119.1 L-alanine-DL-glutamate epimerase [Bradyrhizobium brasilense]
MRIATVDIRCCHHREVSLAEDTLLGTSNRDGFEFVVYTLTTEEGLSASMFGFAGRSARGSGELAAAALKPLLIGRNALDREALWHEFRKVDRFWSHLPIYSYGPADVCLWLLGAEAAGQPLHRYIGGCRTEVPTYLSSMFLKTADDYVAKAVAAKAGGYAAYKLHPPGRSVGEDIEIHAAVRAAVGAEFTLMSDPVAFMTLDEAIRYGRALERLDYRWLEEPIPDENFSALRELSRALDIPVIGTEVLAKHPYSVAECVAGRVVDAVRADVSWAGGVTGVLKTAHLAESFHMNCEIHSAIFQPLELVNLHLCAAVKNCSYFELLCPREKFEFGLASPLPVEGGIATLPEKPGLGAELDWDLIDNATVAQL